MLGESGSPAQQITAFWQWRLERLQTNEPQSSSDFQMAKLLTALGWDEETLKFLEHWLAAHDFGMVFMMGDVLVAPLRGDPRFLAIAKAVGIPSVMD